MINIQVLIVSYRKLIVQLIIELLKGYPLITFEIKTTDVYHHIPITPTSSVVVIDLYQFNQKSIEQRLSLYSKNTLIVILKPDESPIDSGTTPYVILSEENIINNFMDILTKNLKFHSIYSSKVVAETQKRLQYSIKLLELQHLTFREEETMVLVSIGMSNKEIASTLNLKESTVKSYLKSIFQKIQVENRTEALIVWNRLNHSTIKEL